MINPLTSLRLSNASCAVGSLREVRSFRWAMSVSIYIHCYSLPKKIKCMWNLLTEKIVCYHGRWSVYRPGLGKFDINDIDPRLCTHMIYSFIGISTDGSIHTLDSWADLSDGLDGFGKFTRLRQLSPGTKAMVAVGGWNEGSTKFSQVVSNPGTRAQFVQNVVNFLRQYNFDGFDVDWEYPNQRGGQPSDKQNYIALLKELREAFNRNGYLLSVAVAAAESSASKSYLISQLSQYVDFINLMAYDFNGSWNNFVGLNAPLYSSSRESGDQAKLNANSAVRYWLSQGAAANKIILGVPSYGRSFTLANPGNNGLGAPATGPGAAGEYTQEAGNLGYNEICLNLRQGGWTVVRDPQQKAPYAYKGNQWVGYDDVTSIREKANYVNSMGLGGAMMWSLETDDFKGTCGQKYPLLSVLNDVLRGGAPAPAPNPTNPPVDPNPPPTAAPPPPPPPPPPSGTVCTHEGYIRDLNDCSTFYYCKATNDGYQQFTFKCPSGLAFDPSINACNYRDQVPGC
ncbi:chitinase-3-like protein 1 [Calliopsis andreniformis]|uniref:chitinase-3-like protein 1 n=1 Tax=Calliopsis andreniformis TaxID=337506 RepID=UPI003FCE5AA3